ncbi:MAG: hypothetical protein LBS17_04075 [Actinomycetes bacterium]|jgi:hypothetical protein|nr:hypothetical protein [Actinomycetes bacterium]
MARADGRRLKSLDGFTQMVPFIMPKRYDATNYMQSPINYDKIRPWLQEKRNSGSHVGLMALIIASYVRTVAAYPSINRFVVSKKIYARNNIQVSFIALKEGWDGQGEQPETAIKLTFKGDETVEDVADAIDVAIEENRKGDAENATDRIIKAIFSIPVLPSFIVSVLKGMDKLGWLPRAVIDASPFHCSMFITNLASLRNEPVYHHLYDFGTTGAFIALGLTPGNTKGFTLNISTDERISSGSSFTRAFRYLKQNLHHPERLEVPPAEIKQDVA